MAQSRLMLKFVPVASLVLLLNVSAFTQSNTTWSGFWQGQLVNEGLTLDLLIKLAENTDGGLECTMDIPMQNVKNFSASEVEARGDSIFITWSMAQAKYAGKLVSDDQIDGKWSQRALVLDLELKRSEDSSIKRSQEPKGILPYSAIDVNFKSEEDESVVLAGTLTYPSSGQATGAVILVSGSGAQNRDEEIFGHRPFLVIADRLTRAGIAVLRYDDRGTGLSTGDYASATTFDLAKDAAGALGFLKTQNYCTFDKTGLIGHSEGGTIGILLGSNKGVLDFLVLLAAPGVMNEDLLIDQTARAHILRGTPPEEINRDTSYARGVYNLMKNNAFEKPDTATLRTLSDTYFASSEMIKSRFQNEEAFYMSQLAMVENSWFYTFITFDPAPYLRQIRCPTLALNGALDFQVSSKLNLNGIESGLKKGACKDFTVKEIDGLNHMFQPAETGGIEEYGQIPTTFDEATLTLITEWVKDKSR